MGGDRYYSTCKVYIIKFDVHCRANNHWYYNNFNPVINGGIYSM